MKLRTVRFSLMTVAAAVALSTSPAWAQLKIGFNVPLTGFAAADGKAAPKRPAMTPSSHKLI